MAEIICYGEILVDLVAKGSHSSLSKSALFEKFAGGAPNNTATALGRLGVNVVMLGSVGADFFGKFLIDSLKKARVKTNYIQKKKDKPTAVVFASLDSKKIPQFHSFGKGVAYNYFVLNKKVCNLIGRSKIFHFSSISLIEAEYRKETVNALKTAEKAGVIISFDPNMRLHLFKSEKIAKKIVKNFLPYSQILKLGKEEFRFLFGAGETGKICDRLIKQGAILILITDGEKGSEFYFKGKLMKAKAFPVKTVRDTIGAGDAFIAGVLSKIVSFKDIDKISVTEMKNIVSFATVVAAISTTKRGATTALPTKRQCSNLLSRSRIP